MKTKPYSYVIIKANNATLQSESVLLRNKYNPKKKYAFIQKSSNKDGSESINFIDYSNDMELLQNRAASFESWYNYPLNLCKNVKGNINHIF